MKPKNLQPNTVAVANPQLPVTNAAGTQLAVLQLQSSSSVFTVSPGSSNAVQLPIPPGSGAIAVGVAGLTGDTLSNLNAQVRITPGGSTASVIYEENVPILAIEYGVLPSFEPSLGLSVTGAAPSSNTGPIQVSVLFLPPGIVNVSEIVNTPSNPVQVNIGVPGIKSNKVAAAMASGTAVVIPGVAGQTITVYRLRGVAVIQTNTGWTLQDTSPLFVDWLSGLASVYIDQDMLGRVLTTGAGFEIVPASGTTSGSFNGSIWYTQA